MKNEHVLTITCVSSKESDQISSGSAVDSRGRWFETNRNNWGVFLSKTLYPLLGPGACITQNTFWYGCKMVDWDVKHNHKHTDKWWANLIGNLGILLSSLCRRWLGGAWWSSSTCRVLNGRWFETHRKYGWLTALYPWARRFILYWPNTGRQELVLTRLKLCWLERKASTQIPNLS